MTAEQYDSNGASAERLQELSEAELALLARALLTTLAQAHLAPLLARHEHSHTIRAPKDVFELLAPEMKCLTQEQLRVLTLNTRHGILGNHLIYQGTASNCHVRVAEILRPAVIQQATGVIIVHNHPSGDPAPSAEDIRLTNQIVEAGSLLSIDILDHVIIGGDSYHSCRESGLMPVKHERPQYISDPTYGS